MYYNGTKLETMTKLSRTLCFKSSAIFQFLGISLLNCKIINVSPQIRTEDSERMPAAINAILKKSTGSIGYRSVNEVLR